MAFSRGMLPEIGGYIPMGFSQAAKYTRMPCCLKAGIMYLIVGAGC
jgi:hypothetical protein